MRECGLGTNSVLYTYSVFARLELHTYLPYLLYPYAHSPHQQQEEQLGSPTYRGKENC